MSHSQVNYGNIHANGSTLGMDSKKLQRRDSVVGFRSKAIVKNIAPQKHGVRKTFLFVPTGQAPLQSFPFEKLTISLATLNHAKAVPATST